MFTLLIKLILLPSASGTSDVTQEPNILSVPQGESANMDCSHTKDATYFYMSWFQQRQGEQMKLIAFTMPNQEPDFGEFKEQYKEKFSASKSDVQSGSFTVKKLQPDDSGASDVTQNPSILWVLQKDSAEMNCNHSKGASYFYMYWFRQQQGKPMELIAFTTLNQEPDFGTFSKEKYSATKDVAQDGSFKVKKVQADDSGVYFCAVSEHRASDVTQNPSILWVWQKDSAEMNCNHSKGASYFHMYWFRQQQGKPMELIAFTTLNQEPDFGTFSKEKYSATKDVAQDGSFKVKKVQADDSGVYFCAVSEHSLHVSQNPQEILILPDSPLKVTCTITGNDNPNLYWYRWTPTDGLKLMFSSLGVGMTDPQNVGDFTSNRLGLLQIDLESKHVTQIGSAVWYCAANPHSMAD